MQGEHSSLANMAEQINNQNQIVAGLQSKIAAPQSQSEFMRKAPTREVANIAEQSYEFEIELIQRRTENEKLALAERLADLRPTQAEKTIEIDAIDQTLAAKKTALNEEIEAQKKISKLILDEQNAAAGLGDTKKAAELEKTYQDSQQKILQLESELREAQLKATGETDAARQTGLRETSQLISEEQIRLAEATGQ